MAVSLSPQSSQIIAQHLGSDGNSLNHTHPSRKVWLNNGIVHCWISQDVSY
jgi:hypothetical protein